MIILLHGKDNFRSTVKLKQILEEYSQKKSGVNLKFLDEKISFIDLQDEGKQMGMFEEKKLLVGKNLLQNKNLKKEIENNLKQLAGQNNILLLQEEVAIKGKLIKKFEKLTKAEGMVQRYDKLQGTKLKNWYLKEIGKEKITFEKEALKELIKRIGDDLWRAKNEIIKLSNMCFGSEVTKTDVQNYVRGDLKTDIFKTIDALGKKSKKEAVELFEEHLRKGDSPFYIFAMINYQLRNILIVKELEMKSISYKEMQKASKMPPFVFQKTLKNFRDINLAQAKKIHHKLFTVDLDVKLGKITPELGLSLIIACF